MLNISNYSDHIRIVIVMSEIAVQAATVKTRLLEIAHQATKLAFGLQNAAPGDKEAPNPSIQYLLAIAEKLTNIAEDCDEIAYPSSISSPDDASN
jgi:hypothetical protein